MGFRRGMFLNHMVKARTHPEGVGGAETQKEKTPHQGEDGMAQAHDSHDYAILRPLRVRCQKAHGPSPPPGSESDTHPSSFPQSNLNWLV